MTFRLAALSLVLTACADRAPVHIRAFFQAGVPLPGIEVTAVPFNADAVLDSLGRAAETPRPTFPALQQKIQTYRRQDAAAPNAAQVSASVSWLATRDSVARMARELSHRDRHESGYREAYARFRELYARFATREGQREASLKGQVSGDQALASEAAHASDSLRAWETEAYRDFASLADSLVARKGHPVGRAQTDSLGQAELELANGDWWVTARVPDPDNPFQELRWSLPVRVVAGLPFALPLMRDNAALEWRH